jgi:beta-glucosidase
VGVPQDIRWGRTYEGYSENTDLVSQLGVAYLRGLQNVDNVPNGVSVIGTIKHFVGDGGTKWGSIQVPDWMADVAKFEGAGRLDQGATEVDETTLRTTHLPPYTAAVEAGAKSIMVSHSSWGGLKMHAQKYLLTEVLKGELGFKGFVVSDWMGIDQIDLDRYQRVVASVNAGLDMVMVPYDFKPFIADLTRAVGIGDVPLARINDAVRRILTVKFELGLFENPFGDDALVPLIGCEAHRDVAREAVRKSVVLLKNDDHTLPLPKKTPLILIAGQAADDVGLQCGGWTIEWQGETGDITEGTTLLKAIRQTVSQSSVVRYKPNGKFAEDDSIADVGIVVLSEPPYAEGAGDRADLVLPPEDAALLQRVRPRCKKLIVILFSGRPLIITDHLHKWDAFIAAWLPGTEGQGIADVLFGDYPFTGRLPYTWPRSIDQIPLHNTTQSGSDLDPPLFSYGYGLSI